MIRNDRVIEEETSKERLAQLGEEHLSNQELLEIILQAGGQNNAALLAQKALKHFPSLYELKLASLEEWQLIPGIGKNKAILMKAVIEFGRRMHISTRDVGKRVVSSGGLAKRLIEQMKNYEQEHFVVVFLDTKNHLLREKTLFVGSLNQSVAHPREIFKEAVRVSAASFILAHNHPSGMVKPSAEDVRLTRRIEEVSLAIGIRLLDHLIIGKSGYYSMRENSMLG